MKKFAVLFSGLLFLTNIVFAGGILTNTNQSAQFVRMLSRNASTDLDAVYYNPAGLTQLKNGFYLGLHNQSIFQTRTIVSNFPLLNSKEYNGDVAAPLFPDVYAVYKKDKIAFSFGLGPNGGGGSAKYGTGLPSFEKQIAAIPKSLVASGIPTTKYSNSISFDGQSVFWGGQLNGSYAINDMLTVSAGVRVLAATNSYNGYLKDIMVNPNYPAFGASYTGGMVSASKFFADGETFLKGLAATATSTAASLTGSGLPAATPLTALPAATQAGVAQLLGAAGISSTGMNIGTAAATLNAAAPGFAGKAAAMAVNSAGTKDIAVDTKQTGTGFTPIVGVNLKLDKLNVGLKYEMQTTLELTNETIVDGTGLFADGVKSRSDLPAILAAGADYKVMDNLKISGSYNLYFDKNVNWGKNVYKEDRTIDKNSMEIAVGLEYNLTKTLALSAGYLNSMSGVSEQYQSDFSYSNSSYTLGCGIQYQLGKKLVLDAGAMMTKYEEATKNFTDANFGKYTETYQKDTFGFAFGLAYKIF